jgi:hypothetical protein
VKHLPWIVTILLLLVHTTRSSAQLWKYLGKYDPKADLAFDKTLDKEACSITSSSEMYAGGKSTFKIRTYCIRSFDSTQSKIALSEIHHGHVLSIAGPDSIITIDDIVGLVKIHFLSPELLEVVYSPRGGSDQGFEYVMILGVKNDHLCIAGEFLTINEYTIPDEYHLHEVRLKLQGQNLRDCQLTANVRDVLNADVHRSKNYDRKSIYVLRFDTTRKIFYDKVEHLNAAFRMNSSDARPILLTGDYPMVDLGPDEKYYYINDTWYALTKDDSDHKSILSTVH